MNEKVNKKNLRKLCWMRGYHGVEGFARTIGRARTTLHRAVNNPERFGPTIALIEKHLL
jgi:hypothetical protein